MNNTGMSPLYATLTSVSEDLFDKVMAVNFKGPFRLSSLIAERMANAEGGSIISISSSAAVMPTQRELVYASAKLALHSMSSGLARAYGPKVRSNVIVDAPFMTDISKAWDLDAFAEEATTAMALQRGAQSDEIVGAALYLASDASSFTTGAVIKVDGGLAFAAV